MTTLPTQVAFLGEGDDAKYLGCKSNGVLSYSYSVLDRAAKFEVHPASTENGYEHIRSSNNNKYWVRSSESEYAIVAGAAEPNEDTKSWNCTLFEPKIQSSQGTAIVIFHHVQVGEDVGKSSDLELLLMPQASDVARSVFVDYNEFVVLPKHVSFQDDKGKFYRLQWINNHPFIQASGDDSGSTSIMHETSYDRHGNYLIKNVDTGKFWRRSPNWIWADYEKADELNSEILFSPLKVSNSVIALRNLGNNNFIGRLTAEYNDECLNAYAKSIIQEARLTISEPVLTRVIEVTKFRLNDARIYDLRPLVVGESTAVNTKDTTDTTTLTFSRKVVMTRTWNDSLSVTGGVKASFKVTAPLIGETGIELSLEVKKESQWGGTEEYSQELVGSYTAVVPPHTEVMVKMLATVGKCDVPFSYKQTDTLINGKPFIGYYDDGLYVGANAYNYRFESKKVSPK